MTYIIYDNRLICYHVKLVHLATENKYYLHYTQKNIELGSECKMADNPFFPRDNFRPIIRLWILQIDFYLTSGSPH